MWTFSSSKRENGRVEGKGKGTPMRKLTYHAKSKDECGKKGGEPGKKEKPILKKDAPNYSRGGETQSDKKWNPGRRGNAVCHGGKGACSSWEKKGNSLKTAKEKGGGERRKKNVSLEKDWPGLLTVHGGGKPPHVTRKKTKGGDTEKKKGGGNTRIGTKKKKRSFLRTEKGKNIPRRTKKIFTGRDKAAIISGKKLFSLTVWGGGQKHCRCQKRGMARREEKTPRFHAKKMIQ